MPEPTMGEMARWTFYQRFIAERTKDIDPRHVEAQMRLEHPTLDGLSRTEFTEAMYAALAAALDAGPEESEALVARAPVPVLTAPGTEDAGAEALPGPRAVQGVVPAAVGLADVLGAAATSAAGDDPADRAQLHRRYRPRAVPFLTLVTLECTPVDIVKSVEGASVPVYSPPVLRLEAQSSSISRRGDAYCYAGRTVERIDVAIVGGGQAGLGLSHELSGAGIEHAVLERGRVGQTWRSRWDTFCLVTPNWSVQLPGTEYDGDDPDGFMLRDDIVGFLERYAKSFGAPVREGVEVQSVESDPEGGFRLATTAGTIHAASLVLANGAFQRPHRPAGAADLPRDLPQIDVEDYANAGSLPAGGVLVVGSGQSGCQVAEELHEAGRDVVLACGRAAWAPRRIGGRDLVWWLAESGFLDASVASLPSPTARLGANITATGHGGGHDLHLRTLRAQGVTLVGHFLGASGNTARFAPDLVESVAWADDRYRELMELFRKTAAAQGLPMPEIHDPEPFAPGAPEELSLADIGAVIFAGGFRPAYRDWLPWPEAFDDLGFPIQQNGASSVIDGLYFMGVHFLRKRKSSLLLGVVEDAPVVARAIVERHRSTAGGTTWSSVSPTMRDNGRAEAGEISR